MADKKLFEQDLKTSLSSTDRIALGIPGQEGCDNMLISVFMDLLKNVGVQGNSFTDGNLTANVLTINHKKGTTFVELTVYNDEGRLEDVSGMMRIVDADNIEVDFGGEISGIWIYILKYWHL